MGGSEVKKLTQKQALEKIRSLKYYFVGNKDELLAEIDYIIAQVNMR